MIVEVGSTDNSKENGMNVLSLFDGMSCGQIALERAGIKVSNYYASEIKKHAIKVTIDNYPDTIQVGDVKKLDKDYLKSLNIDLLIGGSPCQDFSNLNKERLGLRGEKSSLFFQYFWILKAIKPKYFLLENVVMEQWQQDEISKFLEVEPIMIDSRLVSFQMRKRLYWTNIPNTTIPEDKKISFQDNKSTENLENYKVNKTPSRIKMWEGKCPNVTSRDKICCLTVNHDRYNTAGLVKYEDFCRYLTVEECEKAQTVPIGYTKSVSRNQAWNLLGDGWTIDVVAHIFKGIKR
jgi:DNA (cytosine-5)-methyltransferase 3A